MADRQADDSGSPEPRVSWKEVILRDLFLALLVGGLLLLVAAWSESRRAEQAERLENLRFIRDVATRDTGRMPFRNIDLEGMNLSGLRFPCRDDTDTQVEACSFAGKADFTDAQLADAKMRLMDLAGADFTGADLSGADLRESNLGGVILLEAHLDGVRLDDACWSGTTIWPDDYDPPGSGPSEAGGGEVCDELRTGPGL